jgi:hypothetical protein
MVDDVLEAPSLALLPDCVGRLGIPENERGSISLTAASRGSEKCNP